MRKTTCRQGDENQSPEASASRWKKLVNMREFSTFKGALRSLGERIQTLNFHTVNIKEVKTQKKYVSFP